MASSPTPPSSRMWKAVALACCLHRLLGLAGSPQTPQALIQFTPLRGRGAQRSLLRLRGGPWGIPGPSTPPPQDRAGGADPVASMEALDALVPRAKIAALSRQRSNLQGVLQLLFHGGLFVLAACCHLPFYTPMLGMAFVSAFFFHGLHETVHQTAFRSPWINVTVAHLLGFLCLRPARHYWYYHLDHHRYTGDPQRDSELQPGSFLDLAIDRPALYLFYLSGIPFWVDATLTLINHARGHFPEVYLSNRRARELVRVEARVYLFLYGLVACLGTAHSAVATALLHYWVWPALLAQPILRFYLIAEHRGRTPSTVVYENTRTTYTNWLLRRLAWCMPYHMEHHAWPSVPFYKLREANRLLVQAAGKAAGKASSGEALLEQGEAIPELRGSSRLGYVGFNQRYWMHLVRRRSRRTAQSASNGFATLTLSAWSCGCSDPPHPIAHIFDP